MSINNYVIFNSNGAISKYNINNLVATSDSADYLYIFADFDTNPTSSYRVTSRIKRRDGFIVGPVATEAVEITQDEADELGINYTACRRLTFTSEMLALEGNINITIIYDSVDLSGNVLSTKATGLVTAYVSEAVEDVLTTDEYNELRAEFLAKDLSSVLAGDAFSGNETFLSRQTGNTVLLSLSQLLTYLDARNLINLGTFSETTFATTTELDNLTVGTYRFTITKTGGVNETGIVFVSTDNSITYQAVYLGKYLKYRTKTASVWDEWVSVDLVLLQTRVATNETDISANTSQSNTNKDDISALDSDYNTHKTNTDNPHSVTKSQVGLSDVENKNSETIRGEITKTNVTNALGYEPIDNAQRGIANGIAELNASGFVLSSQLPSYTDDVIEGYLNEGSFYEEDAHQTLITPETGKVYVDLTTELTYRWSGSLYVQIGNDLALGETSSTAYRGDRGKVAYDHSQESGTNPHNVDKENVGLSNVDNTSDLDKPISNATRVALNQKVNNSDLFPIIDVAKLDLFAFDDTVKSMTTAELMAYVISEVNLREYDKPINVGILKSITKTYTQDELMVNCYTNDGVNFYSDSGLTQAITLEQGKIYHNQIATVSQWLPGETQGTANYYHNNFNEIKEIFEGYYDEITNDFYEDAAFTQKIQQLSLNYYFDINTSTVYYISSFDPLVWTIYTFSKTHTLSLSDSPISNFSGYIRVLDDTLAIIDITNKITPAVNETKTDINFGIYRTDDDTFSGWVAYAKQSEVQTLIDDLTTTVTNNKTELDLEIQKFKDGRNRVHEAEVAHSIKQKEKLEVPDSYRIRPTGTWNNEIDSSDDVNMNGGTSAKVNNLGGLSTIQRFKQASEVSHLTTKAKAVVYGKSEVVNDTIVNSNPQQIISKSSNKFDKTAVTNGYYLDSSGNLIANASWAVSDFIEVNENTIYTLTYLGNAGTASVVYYDETQTYISGQPHNQLLVDNNTQITTPANCKYFRTSINLGFMSVDDLQVNEGNTLLPYQPYANHTYSTPAVTLRSVGDVKDEMIENLVVRKNDERIINEVEITLYTDYTNLDIVIISKFNFTNWVGYNLSASERSVASTLISGYTNVKLLSGFDDVNNIGKNIIGFSSSDVMSLGIEKGTYNSADFIGKVINYQLDTYTYESVVFDNEIAVYTNGSLTIDSGEVADTPIYKWQCQNGKSYYVRAILDDLTNAKITNGTQEVALTNGYAKITATDSEYYLSYNQDGVNTISEAQLIELDNYLETKTADELNQIFGYTYYEFGITNSKPKKLISVADNLINYADFYDTLNAVDSDNIEYVTQDSRECIKITNPDNYHNQNIKLLEGKFAPNVQYKLKMEQMFINNSNNTDGTLFVINYTDGTTDLYYLKDKVSGQWYELEFTTDVNKTVSYIGVSFGSTVATKYYNLNKFQLTHADNPTTEYHAYTTDEITFPDGSYPDYGMPSLPDLTRDLIVPEVGVGKSYLGRFVADGNGGWIEGTNENDATAIFNLIVSINHNCSVNDINTALSKYFNQNDIIPTSVLKEGFCLRYIGEDAYLTVRILKTTLNKYAGATNLDKFKAYLTALYNAGTPLEVYYELASPTIYNDSLGMTDYSYIAWNYGLEEIQDANKISIVGHSIIDYERNTVLQVNTNAENIQTNTTSINDLIARVEALEGA